MASYRKTPEAVSALTPEQYRVSQQSGTGRSGTGALLHVPLQGAHRSWSSRPEAACSEDRSAGRLRGAEIG